MSTVEGHVGLTVASGEPIDGEKKGGGPLLETGDTKGGWLELAKPRWILLPG